MGARMLGCLVLVLTPLPAWGEETPTPEPMTLAELRRGVNAALKSEAVSARQGENPAEVTALVDLYLAMAADPRRDESPLVQKLGARVKARLVMVKRKVSRAKGKEVKRPAETVLAQQMGPGGAGGASLPGAAGTAAMATPDYGPELVDLLQRVISPEVWDINGGPATIAYYRLGRALVVRAPGEVHHKLGTVVRDLRAAGGP